MFKSTHILNITRYVLNSVTFVTALKTIKMNFIAIKKSNFSFWGISVLYTLLNFFVHSITAYIAHPKVASLAERDVWLGNDETHYVRKWEGKDVQDLKLLIKLTVS